MSTRAANRDLAVVALLGVVVCTHVFTEAAQRLGWTQVAIAAALYFAGRTAKLW
jgi:alkylhydroperoxidase/carboxymuconolactone decarboxylase family protein YurZ